MKPIVIVTDGNGKVTMTVEELKKALDDAFEQGKAAGTTNINTYPTYRGWWNEPYYNQILCSSDCSTQTNTLTNTTTNTIKNEI